MSEIYGWTGKILRVDLSSGKISMMDTSRYVPAFIGGVGVASRIAWEELSPGVGAFDPENLLFIMTGPLTGTLASGSGRVEVLGIAPQQHPPVFSRSSMGGHWGAELKYAGFDGVIIEGKANAPVYLWITDGSAEIREADSLWGRGTFSTQVTLRAIHGAQTRVISCGQAGEHLARIAAIHTETGNAAGQGGYGALMGSKNLKAVAVQGTGGVKVAKPKELFEVCFNASLEGASPAQTWTGGDNRNPRSGTGTEEDGTAYRMRKCGFCRTPCVHRIYQSVQAEDGTGAASVAQQCWAYTGTTKSVDRVARALTSDYGLNGWEISYGIIPWLQLCRQHGLIDKIDGIDIPAPKEPLEYWRDASPCTSEFLHTLIRKIAFRDGEIGEALADGACYAADKLFDGAGITLLDRIYPRHGGQTEHWGGHWGPGGNVYWPWWLPPLLQWCVDTRDPASDSTHQWTEHVQMYMPISGPRRGPFTMEKVRGVCEKVYGNPDICDPAFEYDPPELKAIPAMWHSHRAMIVDSLVLCDREQTRVFSTLSEDGAADTALMSKLFSLVTGHELSESELDLAGERIWNQLRAVDMRNFGRDRAVDESTVDGFMYPGKDDGIMLDRQKFGTLLDTYYELSGWDPATGRPTPAKLKMLGLSDVGDF